MSKFLEVAKTTENVKAELDGKALAIEPGKKYEGVITVKPC